MKRFGPIFDVEETKRYLTRINRDYNRQLTWQNLFSGVNLGAATAQSATQRDYAADISRAYSSFMKGQQAIQSSGLVGSSLQAYQQQNEAILQEAYNAYMNRLREQSLNIEEQRQSAQASIDSALTTQATYLSDYAEAHLDYLQYLAYTNPELFDSKQWSKYTTAIGLTEEEEARLKELESLMKLNKDGTVKREGDDDDADNRIRFKGSNKKLDEEYRALLAKREGTGTVSEGLRRIMTRDELLAARQNEAGEDIGLFDAEGNLTLKGIDFFDQLQNSPELFDNSFSAFLTNTDIDWLMETNEGMTRAEAKEIARRNAELYEWSRSHNPFDFTVDEYGQSSNLGSFRRMVGLSSDDAKYSFIERFGGYTETEIDEMYSKFYDIYDSLKDFKSAGTTGKKQVELLQEASTEIFSLMRDLGMDGLLIDAGITEDSVTQAFEVVLSQMKSGGEMNEEFIMSTLTGVAAGAAAGASKGMVMAAPQQALPVLGQATGAATIAVATLIGAVAGGVVFGSMAYQDRKRQKRKNIEQTKLSKKAYLDMLSEIVAISQSIRRQAEIDRYFA